MLVYFKHDSSSSFIDRVAISMAQVEEVEVIVEVLGDIHFILTVH